MSTPIRTIIAGRWPLIRHLLFLVLTALAATYLAYDYPIQRLEVIYEDY